MVIIQNNLIALHDMKEIAFMEKDDKNIEIRNKLELLVVVLVLYLIKAIMRSLSLITIWPAIHFYSKLTISLLTILSKTGPRKCLVQIFSFIGRYFLLN